MSSREQVYNRLMGTLQALVLASNRKLQVKATPAYRS